jgi:hypothetical protein
MKQWSSFSFQIWASPERVNRRALTDPVLPEIIKKLNTTQISGAETTWNILAMHGQALCTTLLLEKRILRGAPYASSSIGKHD